MTPREIDALVAEKVFNQPVEWVEVLDYQGKRKEPYLCESNEGYGSSDEVDHYSTSIADAWEVVEKIRGDGRWWQITDCEEEGWHASAWRTVTENDAPVCECDAVADTAPMAICLAALKAVGVEVQCEPS